MSESPFAALDLAAVARMLSQLTDRGPDWAEGYFERLEEVELPAGEEGPGLLVRREEGLAVRLVRGGDVWLAARDGIDPDAFSDAVRHVARVLPTATYPTPSLAVAPWEGGAEAPEVLAFPSLVLRAVRQRRAAFPLALTVRRHRRWLQVVGGGKVVPEAQRESFYSVVAETARGRRGALYPDLGEARAEELAEVLVSAFRGRDATPPEPCRGPVVLAPAAAAVLLHEAVAHALEADLLAVGGDPEAAVGVELGGAAVNVLDDPSTAPEPVRRTSDDEGQPVRRRWLLREGVVAEPLADGRWSAGSELLAPGAARRGGRHDLPAPRSYHLELLPGELDADALLADADGGLYLPAATSGDLDPVSGIFRLRFAGGFRLRGGALAEPVGPCRLAGRVADVLAAVVGVGAEARPAGAGWCAKGGQKMPVWATAPALRLEGVEVTP
jgi:hypothetical protein